MQQSAPWVSFCMSTYKRPQLLQQQLKIIALQTFEDFEVIISDNDPECSAQEVVNNMQDTRFKYFANDHNLGMMPSFNKSIDRSSGTFVVLITDDDPVVPNFLQDVNNLYQQDKTHSLYGGILREGKSKGEQELLDRTICVSEILDPQKTQNLLWSSCVLRKTAVQSIGQIPVYGSPHLADHAFLAMTASVNGALISNTMYSTLSSHDSNFSKFNFNYYVAGCEGFYKTMKTFASAQTDKENIQKVVKKHLKYWFISCMFTLKKYYTLEKDAKMLTEIKECCNNILSFPFMAHVRPKFRAKNFLFYIKKRLGLLH